MITNDTFRWRKSSRSGGQNNACIELGMRWRKSSFSGGENNECVELGVQWRKSSYSGGDPNACVEVTSAPGAVRDSKNPAGPMLRVDLHGFIAAVREDRLAR